MVGDESAGGALIDFLGCADLEQLAVVHDGNAVAHRERLFLVVGDEHEAHPQLALERLEFALHLLTELEVESAERFIEEKHLGFVDERPASATRCCWPPDIWLGLRFSRPASCTRPMASAARARASDLDTFRMRSPKATLSSTFMCGNRA